MIYTNEKNEKYNKKCKVILRVKCLTLYIFNFKASPSMHDCFPMCKNKES